MPPTQSVNVPIFYSSSLESGSHPRRLAHHGADHNNTNDHDSWASALSSKALSRLSGAEAGWINVALDPVDETTWQEEAHWMSFHHAIQSLVVSCQQIERTASTTSTKADSSSRGNQNPKRSIRYAAESSSPSSDSQRSGTGDSSSLAHSITRQVLAEEAATTGAALPVDTIHCITAEEAMARTRLALARAEQDEWEILQASAASI